MFEGLFQPTHLIVILVIVLIVFGPGKLPEIGGAVGRGLNEFKRSVSGSPEPQRATTVASADVKPQSVTCDSCHAESPLGTRFCGQCGKELV